MRAVELRALLEDIYRDRHAIYDRHVRGAQAIGDYEINNTYQYIIAREEVHLAWVRSACEDLGGTATPSAEALLAVPTEGRGAARERAVIEDDARQQQAFIDQWAPRVDAVTHARHGLMLRHMLGEMREHLRFFQLALEGRDDLLGRRAPGASTGDGVLPVRWVE